MVFGPGNTATLTITYDRPLMEGTFPGVGTFGANTAPFGVWDNPATDVEVGEFTITVEMELDDTETVAARTCSYNGDDPELRFADGEPIPAFEGFAFDSTPSGPPAPTAAELDTNTFELTLTWSGPLMAGQCDANRVQLVEPDNDVFGTDQATVTEGTESVHQVNAEFLGEGMHAQTAQFFQSGEPQFNTTLFGRGCWPVASFDDLAYTET